MQHIAQVALLSALALVLSYLETMIPLPVAVPGIKLGLANAAVLVALYLGSARCAAAVACTKVLASGFLCAPGMARF
ncbi:MAG: Gx transporter family protein [Coriobacteriales bacterium]